MEIRTAEEILKEVLEGYNKKPAGWQIASDFRGNSVFLGPGRAYMIKTMMISPQENLGVGARFDDSTLRDGFGLTAPSGFRPMEKDLTQRALSEFGLNRDEPSRQALINRLLSIEPVPTWELEREGIGGILGGPYVAHPDLRMISKSQSELDQRLDSELKNLFMARYPHRASMFR